MHILQGPELAAATSYLKAADAVAHHSRCQKSQRGVVLVYKNEIMSAGFNGPPADLPCELPWCPEYCRDYAMHAEERAIIDALQLEKGSSLEEAVAYHVKLKDGKRVLVDGPSCVACSKLLLDCRVSGVVLEQTNGIVRYGMLEFHERSLATLRPENHPARALHSPGFDFPQIG